jgi:hypothetical protein
MSLHLHFLISSLIDNFYQNYISNDPNIFALINPNLIHVFMVV